MTKLSVTSKSERVVELRMRGVPYSRIAILLGTTSNSARVLFYKRRWRTSAPLEARALTNQGMTEMLVGLSDSRRSISRRRNILQEKAAEAESEMNDLAKIDAALALAIDILRTERTQREAI